nr:deaminase [Nitrosomonas nitrosa]
MPEAKEQKDKEQTRANPSPAPQAEQPLVIALTGPVGSGVSTVSRLLEKEGFRRVSLAAPIKEEFRKRHKPEGDLFFDQKNTPDWRQRLQDIGDEKRTERLDYWVVKALENVPDTEELVIDGVRNLAEIQALRKRFSNCFALAVVASHDTRWERVKDTVYDKDYKAFERDDQRDADEDLPNGQQVEKCVQDADCVIWNEADLRPSAVRDEQLLNKLRPEILLMRGDSPRYPTPEETYITSAYAASHSSRCLKRFVGAVIVSDRGIPLSLGHNENPVGMKPCESEYRFCFKDANMHAKLEAMKNVHCPECGVKHETVSDPWRCSQCRANLKLLFFPSRNMELCTAVHAEERAIRSLGDRSADGATMYVTTFPCFQCSRYIVDAGIARVVYVEAYPIKEAQQFLERNNVVVVPFEGFKAKAFYRIFKQRS